MYYEVMDPIVCLTAAAAATTTLRIGTGIALVPQRDPIQLAKELASLDVLSDGRLEVGVGGGWNAEEMENHGTRFADRWTVLRERVEAMKALWTQDEAEYHGATVDFDPVFQWPKPVQQPHPRVHVGGAVPGGPRRAVRYGDGWIPLTGRGDDDFERHARSFRELAATEGRDADAMQLTVFGAPAQPALLDRYRAGGVDRVLLFVPTTGRDDALRALEAYERSFDVLR